MGPNYGWNERSCVHLHQNYWGNQEHLTHHCHQNHHTLGICCCLVSCDTDQSVPVFLMWHANDPEAFMWASFSLGESWLLHPNVSFISSEISNKCFGRDHLHIKSFCTCRPSAVVWTWNVSLASRVWTLHPHMVGLVWKVAEHLRGAISGYRLYSLAMFLAVSKMWSAARPSPTRWTISSYTFFRVSIVAIKH